MKLLFCESCFDVFKLSRELRTCRCGAVKGRYEADGVHAVVNGKGHSIAIGNGSMLDAVVSKERLSENSHMTRHDYINMAPVHYVWSRPHEGPGNPHTRVQEDL